MTSVMEIPALAELHSRAGASDTDRPAWLAQRLGGVTATQVRELYLQGAGYRQRLLQEKANKIVEAFVGNQYTAWGNKREPVIAEWAKRFSLDPESRVFRAADNPRFLASPDGVGVNFAGELIIDEIKTGKDDLRPDGEACKRKGYLLQMQWGMRVTGARRCLYAWEQHDSDWQDRGGEFLEPAPLHPEPLWAWIEYDEVLVADLEATARSFLTDLDALVAEMGTADYSGPVIDEHLDTLAVNLLRFREMESEGKKAKEKVWAEMQTLLDAGEPVVQESALARVTYNPGGVVTESEVPDVEAAKAADPELFAEVAALSVRWNAHAKQYTKTAQTVSKATLTVTSVKPKKETSK